MVPMVSKAMGTNEYLPINSEYFCSFLAAAASAAEPADRLDGLTLLAARVSVTVTSQVTHLPSDQGIWVTPSGRLPSERTKPWFLDGWNIRSVNGSPDDIVEVLMTAHSPCAALTG